MSRLIFLIACLVAIGAVVYLVVNPYVPDDGSDTPSQNQAANSGQSSKENQSMDSQSAPKEYNKLTAEEERIIIGKGTEFPGSGEYNSTTSEGVYVCRQCNSRLYDSKDKFEAHCGWPSFDDELPGAVRHQVDADGSGRVEILCENCGGHLGHVFEGERKTEKNVRHCVNSLSMKFYPKGEEPPAPIIK